MKQSFKHITSLVSLSFAIALVPTLSFAIEAQPDNQQPTTTGGQSSFCRSLSDITTKTSGEISSRSGKLSSTRDTADKERSSDRSSVDAKLMADRKTWETKRDENFSKLESLAKTPGQKAAVATYVKTIKNAIETRQMANDKAHTQYRTAVDALIAAHRSAVDTRVATFTNSVKTAVATAKATCATNPQTTAETFRASLKQARETFSAAKQEDAKLGPQIKALATTRDAAIKANNETMKQTVEAARTVLKTALKDTSDTPQN